MANGRARVRKPFVPSVSQSVMEWLEVSRIDFGKDLPLRPEGPRP